MSLAGELQAAQAYEIKRPRCSVCGYLTGLSAADRTAFGEALASDMMTVAIHAGLVAWHEKEQRGPVPFSKDTLARHRKGSCRGAA